MLLCILPFALSAWSLLCLHCTVSRLQAWLPTLPCPASRPICCSSPSAVGLPHVRRPACLPCQLLVPPPGLPRHSFAPLRKARPGQARPGLSPFILGLGLGGLFAPPQAPPPTFHRSTSNSRAHLQVAAVRVCDYMFLHSFFWSPVYFCHTSQAACPTLAVLPCCLACSLSCLTLQVPNARHCSACFPHFSSETQTSRRGLHLLPPSLLFTAAALCLAIWLADCWHGSRAFCCTRMW